MSTKNKKKPICPECNSKNVVPVRYGLPSYETFLELKKEKCVLGGCCVDENSPNWACKSCDHQFKTTEI